MFQPLLGHHHAALIIHSNCITYQHVWWGKRSRLQWSDTWTHEISFTMVRYV